jgi:TB2/DP1, HVA22 family
MDILLLTVSVVYPIWQSLKLLEIKKYDKGIIQWLSYWILYAVFWKAESFAQSIAFDLLDK